MGTRSIIKFYSDEDFICAVYQQFDGYTDFVGKNLKEFLKSKPFVNGISANKNVFNGSYCCVAQFISKFKTGAGGLYMSREEDNADYLYIVRFKNSNAYVVKEIIIEVECKDSEEKEKFDEIITIENE